jgi:hypothetical protein
MTLPAAPPCPSGSSAPWREAWTAARGLRKAATLRTTPTLDSIRAESTKDDEQVLGTDGIAIVGDFVAEK